MRNIKWVLILFLFSCTSLKESNFRDIDANDAQPVFDANSYDGEKKILSLYIPENLSADMANFAFFMVKDLKNPSELHVIDPTKKIQKEIQSRLWLFPDRTKVFFYNNTQEFDLCRSHVIVTLDQHRPKCEQKPGILLLDFFSKKISDEKIFELEGDLTAQVAKSIYRIGYHTLELLFDETLISQRKISQNTKINVVKFLLDRWSHRDLLDLEQANLIKKENIVQMAKTLIDQQNGLNQKINYSNLKFNEVLPFADELNNFNSKLENYILLSQSFYLDKLFIDAFSKFNQTTNLTQKQRIDVLYHLYDMHQNRDFFHKNLDFHGTPKSPEFRMDPLFVATEQYNSVKKYLNLPPLAKSKAKPWNGFRTFIWGMGMGVPYMKFMADIGHHPSWKELDLTPFTKFLDNGFSMGAKASGLKIKINGKEHIPSKHQAGNKVETVHIFAPSHRNALRDLMLLSRLNLENYLLVAKGVDYGNEMAHKLYNNPNFIFVGKKSGEPLERILHSLEIGQSDKIVIYPEGMIPGPLGDMNPIRKFSKELIRQITEKGYKVKVYPITWINSTLLFEWSQNFGNYSVDNNKELQGMIEHPIPEEFIQSAIDEKNYDLIDNLIRFSWSKYLPTNELQLFGGYRVDKISE